jgi:hypothetical protein
MKLFKFILPKLGKYDPITTDTIVTVQQSEVKELVPTLDDVITSGLPKWFNQQQKIRVFTKWISL